MDPLREPPARDAPRVLRPHRRAASAPRRSPRLLGRTTGAARRRPAACRACRTSRRRRSTSSTCSRTARRRTSICSTTSRSWRSWHGQEIPDSVTPRQAVQHHDRQPEVASSCCRASPASSQHGAERAPGSATSCRTPRRSPTSCASSSRCTPTRSTTPRPSRCFLTGGRDARPAEPRRLARLRPGQPQRRTCRVRRHDLARQGDDLRADLLRLLLGQRLPAVAVPGREVPRQAATRCCTSPTPTASRRAMRRGLLDDLARAQRDEAARASATRRSPRASRSTRWRSGCRPACPS